MAWNSTYASAPRISPTIMYSGRSRSAARSRSYMSTAPAALAPAAAVSPPKPSRVQPGIQLGCGRFSSRVSSMLTIFCCHGRKSEQAFSDVVLPEAVPPTNSIDIPYCIASQKNAICIDEKVLNSSRSIGVNGSSRNRRMVNVEPLVETSRPRVMTMREPSISVASSSGSAIEMCLPQRCASRIMYRSSSSSSGQTMLVRSDSKRR